MLHNHSLLTLSCRLFLGDSPQVDCTAEVELCRKHYITAFPSIRIFRHGSGVWLGGCAADLFFEPACTWGCWLAGGPLALECSSACKHGTRNAGASTAPWILLSALPLLLGPLLQMTWCGWAITSTSRTMATEPR